MQKFFGNRKVPGIFKSIKKIRAAIEAIIMTKQIEEETKHDIQISYIEILSSSQLVQYQSLHTWNMFIIVDWWCHNYWPMSIICESQQKCHSKTNKSYLWYSIFSGGGEGRGYVSSKQKFFLISYLNTSSVLFLLQELGFYTTHPPPFNYPL